MKFTGILLLAATLQVSAGGYSQITITAKNAPLKSVFKQIQKQSGFDFLYSVELINQAGKVNVDIHDASLEKALSECLKDKPLSFEIYEKTIVIKPREITINKEDKEEAPELPVPIDVRGRVVNENGEPVAGASVVVKGTKTGTTTNNNGEFALNGIDPNATLVITAVNIETIEINLGGRTSLPQISAKTKIVEAAGVVVNTGFQIISKERSTGAVDRVDDKILSKRPVANIANAINGQIAGLVSDPTVGFIIRGRSTLSGTVADRRPLLVVDGFPIEGGFESINPNDVKSVDVLKDAAATSIYGARAANGVVVITTKRAGQVGKMNITYNAFVSVGNYIDLDNYMNMLDSKKQIELDDYFYNTFKATTTIRDPYAAATFRGRLSEYYTILAERDKGYITQEYFNKERERMLNGNYKDDYYKYVLRKAFSYQQNLIISGASDKNAYKFSFLYDNDKGFLQNNNNDRLMLGFSNIYNVTKNIKYTFNSNITFYNQKNNGVNLSQAKSVTSPWTRVFDDNGNYARHIHSYYEPAAKLYESRAPFSFRYNFLEESALRDNLYRGLDIRLQNEFEINITKGLRVKPMFQYEQFTESSRSIYDERSFAVRNLKNLIPDTASFRLTPDRYLTAFPAGGIYFYNSGQRRSSYKTRVQIDYNKMFGNKHEVVAVAGGELISSKAEVDPQDLKYGYSKESKNYALFDYTVARNNIFGENFLNSPPVYEGTNFGLPNSFSRQATVLNERYVAAYANAYYTFNKKYTLTASVRTDASNYISRTNRERFSPFFSSGLRWNMLSEKFMRNVGFLNRLALRATYGSTGNAAGKTSVLPFSVFSAQSPNAETGNYPGGAISGRLNDALTWEKTYSTNLGADFALFKSKLFGSIDLYRRKSEDLITQVQTSNVVWSLTSNTINAAKVLNKGFEITLGTDINVTKNLNWSSSVNFDYNYNEVLEYNFLATRLSSYTNGGTFVAGLPTDRIFAVKIAGITKDGFYIQQKKNGELVIENSSNTSFSGFGTIANTIAGLNVKDDDRIYYMGRSTPPATLGFTNTFTWKGLTLMTVMTGRFGHKVRRTDTNILFGQGTTNLSATGIALLEPPSLTATNATGNILPNLVNRLFYGTSASTRAFYSDAAIQNAGHIRLNEIYLGYDIPAGLLQKAGKLFNSFVVYAQARNLGIIWTNNESKIDPEFLPGSVKPIPTVTFGVRIGM